VGTLHSVVCDLCFFAFGHLYPKEWQVFAAHWQTTDGRYLVAIDRTHVVHGKTELRGNDPASVLRWFDPVAAEYRSCATAHAVYELCQTHGLYVDIDERATLKRVLVFDLDDVHWATLEGYKKIKLKGIPPNIRQEMLDHLGARNEQVAQVSRTAALQQPALMLLSGIGAAALGVALYMVGGRPRPLQRRHRSHGDGSLARCSTCGRRHSHRSRRHHLAGRTRDGRSTNDGAA